MAKRVYTHNSRVFIYQQLRQRIGRCVLNQWQSAHPAAKFLNQGRYYNFLREIYTAYTRKHRRDVVNFPGVPKSYMALMQQIGFCMTRQSVDSMSPHHHEMVHLNRQAAYDAGFLTLSDIIQLEKHQGV